MKVIAGVNSGYTGDLYMNGEHVDIRTPIAAKNLGIEIVYQEVDVALFPALTVAENIMFNTIVTKMHGKCVMHWNEIKKSAKEVLKKLNMKIDVNTLVSKL